MSDEPDMSKIRVMFERMTNGAQDERVTNTFDKVNKAEAKYSRVSGMEAMANDDNGKGYSTGGIAERVALYAGLDYETLDTKANHVVHHLQHQILDLTEKLENSTDPDDAVALESLREAMSVHLVRNVAHHMFWLGFFVREEMVEDGSFDGFDVDSFPKPELSEEGFLEISSSAAAEALIGIGSMLAAATSAEDPEKYRAETKIDGVGVSINQLIALQSPIGNAASATMDAHPWVTEDSNGTKLSIYGMTLAMGIIVGRKLAEQEQ